MTTDCPTYVFTNSTVPGDGDLEEQGRLQCARSATKVLSLRLSTIISPRGASPAAPQAQGGATVKARAARRPSRGTDTHASCCSLGWLSVGPAEIGAIDPHAVQYDRELTRHGDFGALETTPLGDLQSPALEGGEARSGR